MVKSRSQVGVILSLITVLAAVLCGAGCFRWQRDVTLRGVPFTKVRIAKDGLAIGVLKDDQMIGGRPCKKGWVQIHTNGIAAAFTAAGEIQLSRFSIPRGTWVFQDTSGTVTICAFPRDTEVQGHLCRGSGGPAGVQASFYPGGSLKQFFLREDTKIDGIFCKSGLLGESIHLHENGRLKSCMLAENTTRDGHNYQKGRRIILDSEGRILRLDP